MALNLMKTQRRLITLLWLCLTLAGILVYLPGLPGGFVFDDLGSIVYNPAMRMHSLSFGDLYTAMLSSPTGGLMRPLSMLSFALDSFFFGLTPLPFKLINIAIHIGCGLLLWCVARELLRTHAAMRGGLTGDTILRLSTAIAALWLVHPLNLTAVLYVVQRETSLSACFTAAAMLSYLVGRRREREGASGFMLIWLWTPFLTALGMLCKETAALLPVYLLVTEVTLLGFVRSEGRLSRNALGFQMVFLALPLLAAAAHFLLLPPGGFVGGYYGRNFTLYQRLLSESRAVTDYLRWTFLPDIRQLALYHDNFRVSRGLLDPPTTLASIVFLIVLFASAVSLRKRLPLLCFGILWFFAGQALESTILPLELMFEHRNYLPIFGLILGVVGTGYQLAAGHNQLRAFKMAAAICIAGLACLTALRAWQWHSELSFAQYETIHQPQSPRALAELGWSYSMYLNVTHDFSIIPYAVDAELKEKAADPDTIAPDISIADIYAVTGDEQKAKQYLHNAAEIAARAQPTATLKFSLETLHHWKTDKDPALRKVIESIFENAISNPKIADNGCYLAHILNTYGILEESYGEIPSAATLMHRAVTACPSAALLHINFANLLVNYGDPKDARQQVEEIRRLHDIRYMGQLHLLEKTLEEKSAEQKPSAD